MAIREYNGNGGRYRTYFRFQGKLYSKVVNTKAEGQAWEVETKKALRTMAAQGPVLMYSAGASKYLEDCEARMQINTVREKICHLRDFAEYIKEDTPMRNITTLIARDFIAYIKETHGNKAANRRLRNLKACWNWHCDELPDNPWTSVRSYPESDVTKYVPPPEDVGAVLKIATPQEANILRFLLTTGARIGELFNLTWDDVDFERSTLLLWTRKRKGGNRQARLLPLTQKLMPLLRELHNARGSSPYVFVNPQTGGQYTKLQPSVRYMLKRLCKTAEVKEFGFHALRHYVALRLAKSAKANILDIQHLLGHQRTSTTDIYLRSMSSDLGHLAGIIDDEILPD